MSKKPSRKLSVYSNLVHKRRTKKDARARKKAEYLATLPKHPVKRSLARMHPKRVAGYWFSKKGALMLAKIGGVSLVMVLLVVGGAFAYYRKDLDAIRPGELAKRVQTTVTKYYARDGKTLLWEDKGDGDYKLVVDGKNINPLMKKATIAIEDKDFYKHGGISVVGLTRSLVNNAQGGSVQGGSTLTQQLVKQVFFADEAQKRGLNGVPRKIKEMILSIEVERMYNKDQILDLYLNESPYGGRRNGVQSAAKTYFGKDATDLTLSESALLAAIPNQPGLYDPYNLAGREPLIARQHKVLTSMVESGFVTQQEADAAKQEPILDTILPQSAQFGDIKAPHFVQMVRQQLESELGKATVGKGGLTVTTTLDYNIQQKLEESFREMFDCEGNKQWSCKPNYAGFENGAATVEDSKTGQIIALQGSRDFNTEGFGQDNAAAAYIQPGSSIKPLVFAKLLSDQGDAAKNIYGSGTIIPDVKTSFENGTYTPNNADRGFRGNISLRSGLALSRNIPAIKAMAVSGVQPTLDMIRAAGDTGYCTQGADQTVGLAASIGGCGAKQTEHVHAFGTLARNGVYKKQATVLEVKNSQGETLKKWKDEKGKQVIDSQVTYILSDILSDDNARAGLYGRNFPGLVVDGGKVKTATKTGTSDVDGKSRDIWMMSYSPAITMGVWLGNTSAKPLKNGNSSIPGPIINSVMTYAHQEIYAKEGKWKEGDWFAQPEGIQKIGREIYPSWYNKNAAQKSTKATFDKISKKLATDCTPEAARIEVDVIKSKDPLTKKDTIVANDGYDGSKNDDIHQCNDAKPSISSINVDNCSSKTCTITVVTSQGKHPLSSLDIKVNGATVNSVGISGGGHYSTTYTFTSDDAQSISATVVDSVMYSGGGSISYQPS
ncbi:MAG: transglycosylase domain-containing protein [Candidatus Saccharimonadales bacterium]